MKDPNFNAARAIAAIEYDRLDDDRGDMTDAEEALAADAKAYYAEMRMDKEREG